MIIKSDDLSGSEIIGLLQEHVEAMAAVSPPESCHALDLEDLKGPGVYFWSAWTDDNLMGCGAIKLLDIEHAELKSMRTASSYLRQGVASGLLSHIIQQARRLGCKRLSLETGSTIEFEAARLMYERFGFEYCQPFADYQLDPYSVFMTRSINDELN